MSYQEAPAELDREYQRLVAALALAPSDPDLQAAAAIVAHAVRRRCIDLATWKADLSPEYDQRQAQAAELTRLAGERADAVLKQDFGTRCL